MTRKHAWDHESVAVDHRNEGEFVKAGEYYTVAAYELFGERPPTGYAQSYSRGATDLLHAALAYRLGGRTDRCVSRCRQGILMAEDIGSRVRSLPEPAADYDHPDSIYDLARRGAWHEFVGDFRLLGEFDGRADAYDAAGELYRAGGDPELGLVEQEHMNLMAFFENVRLGLGETLDEWYEWKRSATLTDWLDHKRQHLPDLIDDLQDRGEWTE